MKKNQIYCALYLLLILLIGISVRLYLIKNHFSHIDDLGVAKSILEAHEDVTTKANNFFSICSGQLLQSISHEECLKPLKQLLHSTLRSFHTIPINWTYAPFQFYFTNLLIFDDLSYENIKIMGRIPSFLFELLGIYIFIKLIIKRYQLQQLDFSLSLPLILLMLSWEAIIFSAQMESYAIGILTSSILLYIVTSKWSALESRKVAIWVGIIAAMSVSGQYQCLIFIPGFFMALGYKAYKSKIDLKNKIHRILECFASFFIIFLLLPYRFLRDKTSLGINWNSGPNNEFAIPITHHYASFLSAIYEPVQLFIENFPIVIGSMLSTSTTDFPYFSLIYVPLTILSAVGYLSLLNRKREENFIIGIFITTAIFAWIILVGLHKLSFGPTRHSIILIPIFVFCIYQGAFYLSNLSILLKKVIYIFSILLLINFIFSINDVLTERKDKFNEDEISLLLNRYSVDAVINYDSSYSPYLMNSIKNSRPIINANIYMGIKEFESFSAHKYGHKNLSHSKPYVIAFYSHFSPFDFKIHNQVITLIKKEISPNQPMNGDLLYSEEIPSNTQIDWSNKTSNGANGLYFYIYKFY